MATQVEVNPRKAQRPSERREVFNEGVNVDSKGPGQIKKTESPTAVKFLEELDFSGLKPSSNDENDEGQGPKVVVLVDYVTGGGMKGYYKGQVLPVSKLVNGYGDKKSLEYVKQVLERLFLTTSSIRFADMTEESVEFVEVSSNTETPEFQAERERRIESERENEQLREALRRANVAQSQVSPSSITGNDSEESKEPKFE